MPHGFACGVVPFAVPFTPVPVEAPPMPPPMPIAPVAPDPKAPMAEVAFVLELKPLNPLDAFDPAPKLLLPELEPPVDVSSTGGGGWQPFTSRYAICCSVA